MSKVINKYEALVCQYKHTGLGISSEMWAPMFKVQVQSLNLALGKQLSRGRPIDVSDSESATLTHPYTYLRYQKISTASGANR